jgi:hypothetical protein
MDEVSTQECQSLISLYLQKLEKQETRTAFLESQQEVLKNKDEEMLSLICQVNQLKASKSNMKQQLNQLKTNHEVEQRLLNKEHQELNDNFAKMKDEVQSQIKQDKKMIALHDKVKPLLESFIQIQDNFLCDGPLMKELIKEANEIVHLVDLVKREEDLAVNDEADSEQNTYSCQEIMDSLIGINDKYFRDLMSGEDIIQPLNPSFNDGPSVGILSDDHYSQD